MQCHYAMAIGHNSGYQLIVYNKLDDSSEDIYNAI